VTTGRLVNNCLTFTRENLALHTGELSSFLDKKAAAVGGADKYDLAILDFCGSWPGIKQEQRRCVGVLFEKNLLEDVSVLEVTLSFRNGDKRMEYMHQIMAVAATDIQSLAQKAGYLVQLSKFFTNGNIFYLFFKVMLNVRWPMSEASRVDGKEDTLLTGGPRSFQHKQRNSRAGKNKGRKKSESNKAFTLVNKNPP